MTLPLAADTYKTLDVRETVRDSLRVLGPLRFVVLVSLILTYVWRFHDLSGVIRPLRLSALATVGSWLILLVGDQRHLMRRLRDSPYLKLFLVWSAWILISTFWALDQEVARRLLIEDHLKIVTMVLFFLSCPPSRSVTRLMIYAMSFGAAVICFFYVKGGFSLWGSPVPMYDVNDMALMLNAAIPLCVFLILSERSGFSRGLICMVVLLSAFCVLMTRSRGGFLTLGCIAALFLFYVEASRWLKLTPVVMIVVGFFLVPSAGQDRLLTLFNPSADYNVTGDGRFAIWKRGAGYLSSNPISGVGYRNFALAETTISPQARKFGSARAKVTHNSLVEIFVETGLVGGLLYLAMIGSVFRRLLKSRGRMKKQRRMETRVTRLCTDFVVVSVVAFLIGGFFLALGYTPVLFVLLTIGVLIELGDTASSQRNPLLGHRRQGARSLRTAP